MAFSFYFVVVIFLGLLGSPLIGAKPLREARHVVQSEILMEPSFLTVPEFRSNNILIPEEHVSINRALDFWMKPICDEEHTIDCRLGRQIFH